jgi:tryptophan synthase alpha chain
MTRIKEKYAELKNNNKKAFTSYICAGDPDYKTSLSILKNLPQAGADIIELGIPFLDPAGDGPIIENASRRAINNGMNLRKTLNMVNEFRQFDNKTPIVLMGYFNPILKYGIDKIFLDAKKAGVDGFLIVDLPFEEENEIIQYIKQADIDLIQLIAPTTNKERATKIVKNASGFLYLISILGITGTKDANPQHNIENVQKLRSISKLPIAIGFGIKTPEIAAKFCQLDIDGVVVGSTIVEIVEKSLQNKDSNTNLLNKINETVGNFSNITKSI